MSEDCQDLRDFLSGNADYEFFSDIESLRAHWYECEECRTLVPDAISRIDSTEKAYLSCIRDNLQVLHRQFEHAESQVLHPPVNDPLKPLTFTAEDVHTKVIPFTATANLGPSKPEQVLKLLADAGFEARGQLQGLNENWGLCSFCVAQGDCEYYSEVCGPLISSLHLDVQLFVFRAMLAAEILEYVGSPEEFPARFSSTIYRTIEIAAPEFLRKYLREQEALIHNMRSPSSPHEVLTESLKKLSERVEWIEDGVERLKNLGTEQIDLLKSGKQGISVDDDELCAMYGQDLYRKLSPETQRLIRKAELHFRDPKEGLSAREK